MELIYAIFKKISDFKIFIYSFTIYFIKKIISIMTIFVVSRNTYKKEYYTNYHISNDIGISIFT